MQKGDNIQIFESINIAGMKLGISHQNICKCLKGKGKPQKDIVLGGHNMKECIINKHNVVLYDSIDELPMLRFHKYNKMLLVDAGVGSDLSDFDRHIER